MNQAAMRRNPMMTSTSGIHSFLPSLPTLSNTSSPKSSLQAAAFLLFNDFKRPGGVKPPIEALYCSNVIDIFRHQGHFKKIELLSQNCPGPAVAYSWTEAKIFNMDQVTTCHGIFQALEISRSWKIPWEVACLTHGNFQVLEISMG